MTRIEGCSGCGSAAMSDVIRYVDRASGSPYIYALCDDCQIKLRRRLDELDALRKREAAELTARRHHFGS